MMTEKQVANLLVSVYGPHSQRKQVSPLTLAALGGNRPSNKSRTLEDRMQDSIRHLEADLSFLAGMLTVLPSSTFSRREQLQYEGEKILNAAHKLRVRGTPSASTIRKMRISGERVAKLRTKIKKEAKAKA